jgi:hypothetical protein
LVVLELELRASSLLSRPLEPYLQPRRRIFDGSFPSDGFQSAELKLVSSPARDHSLLADLGK